MRKRISLLAACGLVALGTAAVPANAADPVFPLVGPAALDLPLPVDGGSAREQRLSISLDQPATPTPSFKGLFTVDLSKVAGVATVREHTSGPAHHCIEKDGGLECAYVGLPVGLELDVAAAKGAANGATGEITVTGKTPGATITPLTTKISVGGPDLVMREMKLKKDLTPGESQPMPLVFANAGTQAAKGVVLELGTTRGMELVETYDNCRTRTAGDLTTVLCAVEGDFVPGAVYELAGDSPLHIKATRHAYDDSLVYGIHPAGDEPKAASWSGKAATGRTLTAIPAKSAPAASAPLRATDLNPGDNRREFAFHTQNTADFATSPVSLKGKKDDTLSTAFTFENKGPAWIRAALPADSLARTVVVVPEGAKVTRKPQECLAVDADGTKRAEQLGAPRYECALGSRVSENEKVVYPFDLKIEKVVEGAKGSVTVGDWGASAPRPHAFDPNAADNTAAVVINAKGGTGTGPSPSPSTSGSPSPSPSVSASASPSSTSTASGGTGTGTTAQGGNLASTGSTVGPLAVGAAALVAAGGALYVAVRRRGARG
ncbi:peptidase [Streptomyces sp. NPDC058279]|uniref:peptidase n=1 Tax=Streptomyces sp. NPDC058279 TaxID=3346418 RepID=UPI0036EF2581